MSYLDRGQAAARVDCSVESNMLAPTLVDVKPQGGLGLAAWRTIGHHKALAPSGMDEITW